MSEKALNFVVITVLFVAIILGTILYTNRVQDVKDNKITIISNSEMDK